MLEILRSAKMYMLIFDGENNDNTTISWHVGKLVKSYAKIKYIVAIVFEVAANINF